MYVYLIFVYEWLISVLFSNSLFTEMKAKTNALTLVWLLCGVRFCACVPQEHIASAKLCHKKCDSIRKFRGDGEESCAGLYQQNDARRSWCGGWGYSMELNSVANISMRGLECGYELHRTHAWVCEKCWCQFGSEGVWVAACTEVYRQILLSGKNYMYFCVCVCVCGHRIKKHTLMYIRL